MNNQSKWEWEEARFKEADKINIEDYGYDQPLYREGYGYEDGYFDNIGDLIDWLSDETVNENPDDPENPKVPEWAFAVEKEPLIDLNFSSDIMDRIEFPEGLDDNDVKGQEALSEAIDKFNKVNKHLHVYNSDYKKVVLLKINKEDLE